MTNEERAREAVKKMKATIMWDDAHMIILAALNAATAELEEERGRWKGLLAEAADDMDEARQLIASWDHMPAITFRRSMTCPAI